MNSKENNAQFNRRLIGFLVWASLMTIAFFVTMNIDLKKTVMVPIVFLPLMVPMVLLPLKWPREKGPGV